MSPRRQSFFFGRKDSEDGEALPLPTRKVEEGNRIPTRRVSSLINQRKYPAWEDANNVDALKLFEQCKLRFAYALAPGSDNFFQRKNRVLRFRNVNYAPYIDHPDKTYSHRVNVSRSKEFESLQESVSGNIDPVTASGVAIEGINFGMKAMKETIRENESYCATATTVRAMATIDIRKCVGLKDSVLERLRNAISSSTSPAIRYTKLMEVANDVGLVVVSSCDIGVRASCCDSGEATSVMTKGSFKANFRTAAKIAAGRMRRSKLRNVCSEWHNLEFTLTGPTNPSLSGRNVDDALEEYAKEMKNFDCVTVHKVTTIFDMIPTDTEENNLLKGEVEKALKWRDSWKDNGRVGYWQNVQPIRFGGYAVWWVGGHKRRVFCRQFATRNEAQAFFDDQLRPSCIFHHICESEPKEIECWFGGNFLFKAWQTAKSFHRRQINGAFQPEMQDRRPASLTLTLPRWKFEWCSCFLADRQVEQSAAPDDSSSHPPEMPSTAKAPTTWDGSNTSVALEMSPRTPPHTPPQGGKRPPRHPGLTAPPLSPTISERLQRKKSRSDSRRSDSTTGSWQQENDLTF